MKKLSYIVMGGIVVFSIFLYFTTPKPAEAFFWIPIFAGVLLVAYFFPNFSAKIADTVIGGVLSVIMQVIHGLVSLIFRLAGVLFDSSIHYSVVVFTEITNKLVFIRTTWELIINVANITFIFMLLYLGITTILEVSKVETKKTLVHIIIVALIMNFSLFFTKVVIDVSNLIAFQFFNSVQVKKLYGTDAGSTAPGRISSIFVEGTYIDGMLGKTEEKVDKKTGKATDNSNTEVFIAYTMAIIFELMGIFIFISVAIMFFRRTLMLIFYMISSPIAMLGYALPKLASYKEKWLSGLINNAFLAPVYLFCIYLIAKITTDKTILKTITPSGDPEPSMVDAITVRAPLMFINFGIIIGMFYGSYMLAKKMSADATAGTGDIGKWIQNKGKSLAGRNVIGRPARIIDKKLGNTQLGNTVVGQYLRGQTTQRAINSKFGGDGQSLADSSKAWKERKKTSNTDREKARLKADASRLSKIIPSVDSDIKREEVEISKINTDIAKIDASPMPLSLADTTRRADLVIKKNTTEAKLNSSRNFKASTLASQIAVTRRMSISALEEMKPAEVSGLYGSLSNAQREKIQNSATFTHEEREGFKATLSAPVISAVASGNIVAIQDSLSRLSDADKANLPESTITNPVFLTAIKPKDFFMFMDSDITPATKASMKSEFYKPFLSATVPADEVRVSAILSDFNNINKIDQKYLVEPAVIDLLRPAHLSKLNDSASMETRRAIYKKATVASTPPHPLNAYMYGPNGILWNVDK